MIYVLITLFSNILIFFIIRFYLLELIIVKIRFLVLFFDFLFICVYRSIFLMLFFVNVGNRGFSN